MNEQEQQRYSRQILFPPIALEGQEKINAARVCIVGCGALGSFQAESLARAGVGELRLIDRDYVDITNLQRQWLYDQTDAEEERPKAVAAADRLQKINRHVKTSAMVADVTPSNAEELLADCDVILDGTDNFETRYLINDVSVKRRVPWIYGAAIGSYGISMPIWPGRGPCFACIYPETPQGLQPTCDVNGVLSAVTATVAASQVVIALRMIVGWPDFKCHLQTLDVWTGEQRRIPAVEKDAACTVCGRGEFQYLEGQRRVPVSLCGRNAVQLHETARRVDLSELAVRLRPFGEVRMNEFALRMIMPEYQLTFFPDGRAIIKGTTDVGVARSLYARLIGS